MTWESPYQTRGFHLALLSSGFESHEITHEDGNFYFSNWMSENLTGWELDRLVKSHCPVHAEFFKCNGVVSEITCRSSYYTLVIQLDHDYESYYSKSCKRNILKAKKHLLSVRRLSGKPLVSDLEHYIGLFKKDDDVRGLLSWSVFESLIRNLVRNNCADVFICTDQSGEILSVAITILSKTIANLRFTAYAKETQGYRPMNLLIHEVANYYHEEHFAVLDLSGFDVCHENDRTAGINRFKISFSQTVVEFKNFKNLCIQS